MLSCGLCEWGDALNLLDPAARAPRTFMEIEVFSVRSCTFDKENAQIQQHLLIIPDTKRNLF